MSIGVTPLSDNDKPVADSDPAERVRRITIRRFANAAEADRHDVEFWRQLSDAERVLQVWRLSQEQWRLRGELPDEPGLCRSVARVHRR
jgi:hypothetical protein